MRRTRLLFVDHATTVGGGERSMLELAAALDHRRYEVVFALPGPGPLAAAVADTGARLYFYRAAPSLLNFPRGAISPLTSAWWRQLVNVFAAARSLRQVVAAEGPDLVHSHSQKAHVFATLAGFRTPVVWHMRDVLRGRFARVLLDVLAAWGASGVIAISGTVAGQFRWARRKVRMIYNGVAPPEPLSPAAAARLKSEWGVPRGSPVIGYVSQIAPWKGQRIFVEAAAGLAQAFQDLYFVVIGSPLYGARAYRAELVREVKRLGLAPRFRFLGQQEEAARAIGAFDVLVHTPVEPEPFGRVVVEAMARGVPVVAARTGGISEIMADGREGFLVRAGHAAGAAAATAFLLDDPILARALGAHGRETYRRRFTVERLCREIKLVYYEILGGGGPARRLSALRPDAAAAREETAPRSEGAPAPTGASARGVARVR